LISQWGFKMFSEDQLRERINGYLDLIKYSPKALKEASERATEFLIATALLADAEREAEEDRAKFTTLVAAAEAQAFARSKAKQVTEKKVEVENDPMYTEIREILEQCEAKIKWIKTYIRIFENAHIVYRQFSKE